MDRWIGKCRKCDGKGKILMYSHIANGKCSACCGSGKMEYRRRVKSDPAKDLADMNARLAALYPNSNAAR